MLTLNQQIEILKNFTSKHKGLNSYYHEGINKLEENADSPVYPKFESILESMDNTKDMFSCKFRLFVSDLVNKDKTNRDLVISDCSQIANDFLYYIKKIVRDRMLPTFICSTDIQLTDYLEAGTDEEAGVFFEFTIKSHIGSSSCNLPIDAGNILDNNYIYVGGSTSGNFVVEIKDQDGNILQTFNTSGQYVVTVLTGIQQVIGNTSTTITQDIID